MSLQNKTLFITGGTGALGEQLVRHCLDQKARVFFTFFSNESKAKELERAGATGFQSDFSKPDFFHSFEKNLLKETSHLDGLIHNAGIVRDKTIQNMSDKEWENVIQVNAKAPIHLTFALLPLLQKSPAATKKIITVISRVGLQGGFGEANYAASKEVLIDFTRTAAKEFAPDRITVNGINPGFMLSTMTHHLPSQVLEKNRLENPLQTFSDPAEVAHFIGYLLSDASQKVTGQILHYDCRQSNF